MCGATWRLRVRRSIAVQLLTPGQQAAAKREDFKNVKVALAEFKQSAVDEALRILKHDVLEPQRQVHRADAMVPRLV